MNTESWDFLGPQDRGVWPRQLGGGSDGFQFQTNSTSSIANEVQFAVSKSFRSTFIILACFNVAAAAATALVIFWDCYTGAKRSDPGFRLRSSFLSIVGTVEIFPFVLSIGIVAQGIIYVVAQAKGLEKLLISGCTPISQAMLPALFIVPYIQLTFGLETTLQALRRRPFPRRSKWTVPACLAIVIVGLVGTYVVTRFIVPPDLCLASLFWFVQTWGLESFGILTGIASTLLIGVVIISVRLRRNLTIGAVERVTASRMVYFMVLGTILNGLTAPFFYSISSQDPLALTTIQVRLSMAAMAAGNASGIAVGALYVFLRSSRMRRIGPRGHVELGGLQPKGGSRTWAPGADVYNTHMERPVSPPMVFKSPMSSKRSTATGQEMTQSNGPSDDDQTDEGPNEMDPNNITLPIGSEAEGSNMGEMAQTPVTPPRKTHARKESYSLFPNRRDAPDIKLKGLLPATSYTPTINVTTPGEGETDMLLPPPRVHEPGAIRHSILSLVSSATVQIGLRVSNVGDVAQLDSHFFQQSNDSSVTSRGPDSPVDPALRVNPRNKQLPPLPLNTESRGDDDTEEEEQITLSPAVYNPLENATRANISGNHNRSHASLPSALGDGFEVEEARWI